MRSSQLLIKYRIPFLLFIILTIPSVAQKDTTYYDQNYISSFYDKLGIYAYGITKFSRFEFNDKDNDKRLNYSPNENFNLGLGFNYKWMGIGFAFNIGSVNSDNELYGKTKSLDLQVDIYLRRWVILGNLQHYSGYYWSNPDDFFGGWDPTDSVIKRPDIKTYSLGFGGIYTFNYEKFSFKAAFVNNAWQKKSAGSLLSGWFLSAYAMGADSSLVPVELQPEYPNVKDMVAISSLNLGTALGYSYTFVIKKRVYINLSLLLGINLQGQSAYDIAGESVGRATKISSNAHSRFAIGFNHEKYYFGFSGATDTFLIRSSNSDLSYSYGKVRFFYGRRFSL